MEHLSFLPFYLKGEIPPFIVTDELSDCRTCFGRNLTPIPDQKRLQGGQADATQSYIMLHREADCQRSEPKKNTLGSN